MANNYINNEEFIKILNRYKKEKKKAIKNKEPIPHIPEDIGLAILNIARGLARRPNFSGYTFKEDMISDGVENCINYIDNFDSKISKNPFSYFTQIIYYAFLRRIEFESKQSYVKYKSFEVSELYSDHKHERKKHVNLIKSIINEKTQDTITKFETRQSNKSTKSKKSKNINLELFME